jgi:hypothetical protein
MTLVVVEPVKRRHCAECHQGPLPLLVLEFNAPRCLDCAGLSHLVLLPRGDAALTRRAREGSSLWAVVVRHHKRRKRYERRGLLVEEEALARAESACLADADARARRRARDAARRGAEDTRFTEVLATTIRALFPGCPPERVRTIAAHTSQRGSGRVGRSAAGRALDPDAVTAAVRASVRHEETPYDDLLLAGIPRHMARAQVAEAVEATLETWRAAPRPSR